MPVKVRRHAELPLIIATLTGDVIIDDVMEMFRRSAELFKPEDALVYRITHVKDATSTFSDMLQVIQSATQQEAASTSDRRVQAILVGTSSWITFVRNALQKRGVNIPLFESIDMAMEFVYLQLEETEARKAQ
ncbi:hypothetical protein G4Y79_24295 [Phototrophicus methaneseepsis]|uniref:STAS domain-containing protein n=1 Tax=Phototrophicus methaneseepsis TaxID=2710758 RepID=A0A7S8IEN8_9CHLR|nr:hypothetical protein [Phototrophicus methaneseepsis]QPC82767.1 hypothetical protein G4Y79_24295 [Phototrophicus methaneseepsis]